VPARERVGACERGMAVGAGLVPARGTAELMRTRIRTPDIVRT